MYLLIRRQARSTLFPYTTLFRSIRATAGCRRQWRDPAGPAVPRGGRLVGSGACGLRAGLAAGGRLPEGRRAALRALARTARGDAAAPARAGSAGGGGRPGGAARGGKAADVRGAGGNSPWRRSLHVGEADRVLGVRLQRLAEADDAAPGHGRAVAADEAL